jgi:hypothetical protein
LDRRILNWLCCSIVCSLAPALADPRGVDVVPQVALPGTPLKTYVSTEGGISFSFPASWSLQEKPDKDTIMKASADSGSNLNGEIALDRYGDLVNGSEKDSASMIETMFLAKLGDYKKLSEQDIVFGPQRLRGHGQIFTASVNGMNIWQRRIYFSGRDGRLLVLTFSCPPQQSQYLIPLSNNILSSVRENQPAAKNVNAAGATSTAAVTSLATYIAKSAGISFAYPSDWQVQNAHESNLEVKLAGLGANGKRGEVTLHSTDANYVTSEDLSRGLEAEANKATDIKHYSEIHSENQNFGASSNISGLVTENTFEFSGQQGRQMVGFFKEGDRHFIIAVRGLNWSANELHNLFSKITGSIRFTSN